MKKYTKLTFHNVSSIAGTKDVGVIALVDEDNVRQLSIPCDNQMVYQFGLRISHAQDLDNLLPEVLVNKLLYIGNRYEIIITNIANGHYEVVLEDIDSLEQIPMRASDAVLLSYIGNIPIFIDEDLMQRQCTNFRPGSSGLALPVNSLSDEMLQKAMEQALKDENYDLASRIRDERKSRIKKAKN